MSSYALESLLFETGTIRKAYDLVGKTAGENFNLFTLLGVQNNEVGTHSMMLGELLNPKGSHGLGDVFLAAFIKQIRAEAFDLDSATVFVEHYLGRVTSESGGFIDILISSKTLDIVIENKIYARDQPNQLLRYRKDFPSAKLYYLTLFGNQPSEVSTGKKLEEIRDYFCISYAEDIQAWLETCRKEAANFPILRETIAQYIQLIKILTNQTLNNKMNEEIVERIIRDKDSLTSFFEMQQASRAVNQRILDKWKEELEAIAKKLQFNKFEFTLSPDKNYTGFYFQNAQLDALGLNIHFIFSPKYPTGLLYGFTFQKPEEKHTDSRLANLKDLFSGMFNKKVYSDKWWLCYSYWDEYEPVTMYYNIYSGNINDDILQKMEKMLEISKQVSLDPQ